MFTVTKVSASCWMSEGEYYFPIPRRREKLTRVFRTQALAEACASNLARSVIEQAEEENDRFDRARAYLARRAARRPNEMQLSFDFMGDAK